MKEPHGSSKYSAPSCSYIVLQSTFTVLSVGVYFTIAASAA